MEIPIRKQRTYLLQSAIEFSSDFQSGNLAQVQQKDSLTFNLWVESDPKSTYKTWFYFSVKNIPINAVVTFCIVNMSNQVKLFKEGHVPVFRNQESNRWNRIPMPIQQNGVAKGEEGFQLTFRHCFNNKSKHYFAFSYPWTYSDCNNLFRRLVEQNHQRCLCDYRPLAYSSKKVELNILTLTKLTNKTQLQTKQFKNIQNFSAYTFPKKRGIFVSARVHPGEVASSHIINGFTKYLLSKTPQAEKLLEHCVFYIVPMLNPDGVIDGNFRCDSLGHNLNRFYTCPTATEQPQIYAVKSFVIEMIRAKLIHFCLDLHAHVNKQGSFAYGNSVSTLKEQVAVCLFPKLLEYNSRFFDYQSCNFSEKNMSSKDKGDEMSKQGASRVTFFKQTGMVSCWTLQCNYNSSRLVNQIPKESEQQANCKPVSNGVILDFNPPPKKQQIYLMNIEQFQEIGVDIAITILDYYRLRTTSRYINSKLKNWTNFQLSLAVSVLRLIPFRFDNECRKLLNNINSGQCINDCFSKILEKLQLDPIGQYLSAKELKEKSRPKDNRAQSLKTIKHQIKSVSAGDRVHKTTTEEKLEIKPKMVNIMPNIPKIPRKK